MIDIIRASREALIVLENYFRNIPLKIKGFLKNMSKYKLSSFNFFELRVKEGFDRKIIIKKC